MTIIQRLVDKISKISYCKDMSALKKAFSCQSSVISLLIFTILFIANLFIFTSPVFAADLSPTPTPCSGDWCPLNSNNYNDEIATQRFGQNILSFGYATMFGQNPGGGRVLTAKAVPKIENGQTVLSYVPGLSKGDINNGALALATQGIIALYNPPTSSIEYLANLGESIGIAPRNVYAQSVTGAGANVIKPVYNLWLVMRNIAYVAFILVFITAGVMIMFRQKLNPQTVIGIQQALPGLIIGLILVTFSYFIAAFIVDFTFVGMRLVAAVFQSTGTDNYYSEDRNVSGNGPNGSLEQVYQKSDAFDMYGRPASRIQTGLDVFGGVWGVINPVKDPTFKIDGGDIIDKAFKGAVPGCIAGSVIPIPGISCVVGGIVGGLVGAITSVFNVNPAALAGGVVVSTLAAILVPLILAIALMIQFIKLIIALLMSYIQILIMVIFGPFFILFSAIPGRGGTLNYWLKALIANVLVFPAVFAGFLFAGMLLNFPFEPKAAMPLFGGIGTGIIGTLLAFGVLLGLPSIPDMVREALGVKGPKGFTQAALGGFMGGFNAGRGGYNQAMEKTGVRAQQQGLKEREVQAARDANAQGGPGDPVGIRGWAVRGWNPFRR